METKKQYLKSPNGLLGQFFKTTKCHQKFAMKKRKIFRTYFYKYASYKVQRFQDVLKKHSTILWLSL